MKLDTKWLEWQSAAEKFEKSIETVPAKTAEMNIAVSAGSLPARNSTFSPSEANRELYEEGVGRWARERCMFSDRTRNSLRALHGDYAKWADKVDRDVPCSFGVFKWLLQDAEFSITDDGMIAGLILVEDLRALQRPRTVQRRATPAVSR